MTITQQQSQEMLEAAKPLIKWLNENAHPHCMAVVDQNTIELVESVAVNRTSSFAGDFAQGRDQPNKDGLSNG